MKEWNKWARVFGCPPITQLVKLPNLFDYRSKLFNVSTSKDVDVSLVAMKHDVRTVTGKNPNPEVLETNVTSSQ